MYVTGHLFRLYSRPLGGVEGVELAPWDDYLVAEETDSLLTFSIIKRPKHLFVKKAKNDNLQNIFSEDSAIVF
jgi:hypothetical protein